MILKLLVNDQTYPIEVPQSFLTEAEDFFAKMDSDMAQGWQMSREWVESPTLENRCQIAADKLLTAIEQDNRQLILFMAGYILSRQPQVREVQVDTGGDMLETAIILN